jgi:hypothetical protein
MGQDWYETGPWAQRILICHLTNNIYLLFIFSTFPVLQTYNGFPARFNSGEGRSNSASSPKQKQTKEAK